jgi:ElaB/YqjD/DUF883 family membrane-anchored ribosome-binding protein
MTNEAQQQAGNFVDTAAKTAHQAIDKVGSKLGEYQDCADECKSNVKDFVTNRPLSALAVTLGVGVLVGLVLGRK